jgi:hypothetical protein
MKSIQMGMNPKNTLIGGYLEKRLDKMHHQVAEDFIKRGE